MRTNAAAGSGRPDLFSGSCPRSIGAAQRGAAAGNGGSRTLSQLSDRASAFLTSSPPGPARAKSAPSRRRPTTRAGAPPPATTRPAWAGEGEVCRFALVDYAGVADAYLRAATQGALDLGTTFAGSVKVDPASGGCVQVAVKLRTHNALTLVTEGTPGSTTLQERISSSRPRRCCSARASATWSKVPSRHWVTWS